MPEARSSARFRLYLISDRRLAAATGGLASTVEAALAGAADANLPGAVAVQLREKDLEAHQLYELALALRPICTRFGAPLMVNDRIDVAIAAGADGAHLASTSFSIADARALLGPARLIGISTHSVEEVATAAAHGADFAVFGPIYDPLSKGAYGPAKGLKALAKAVKAAKRMPLYALGGINKFRAGEIAALPSGTRPAGVAAIGAVFGTSTPALAARELIEALKPR
jgi:thiamine-phosphate pyrophosphorylase